MCWNCVCRKIDFLVLGYQLVTLMIEFIIIETNSHCDTKFWLPLMCCMTDVIIDDVFVLMKVNWALCSLTWLVEGFWPMLLIRILAPASVDRSMRQCTGPHAGAGAWCALEDICKFWCYIDCLSVCFPYHFLPFTSSNLLPFYIFLSYILLLYVFLCE